MNKLISLIICILLFLSCDKVDKNVNTFPVKYFMPEGHKKLLENYSLNDTLVFESRTNETILLEAGRLYTKLTYGLNEVRQGEELVLYYTSPSYYLPTFKIGYQHFADSDSTSLLNFITISGELENTEQGQNFYASTARLTIASPDSIFISIADTPFTYSDSLTFGSDVIMENYTFKKMEHFGWGLLSTYVIYNKEYGIVEFDTKDGKIWRLNLDKLR